MMLADLDQDEQSCVINDTYTLKLWFHEDKFLSTFVKWLFVCHSNFKLWEASENHQ